MRCELCVPCGNCEGTGYVDCWCARKTDRNAVCSGCGPCDECDGDGVTHSGIRASTKREVKS